MVTVMLYDYLDDYKIMTDITINQSSSMVINYHQTQTNLASSTGININDHVWFMIINVDASGWGQIGLCLMIIDYHGWWLVDGDVCDDFDDDNDSGDNHYDWFMICQWYQWLIGWLVKLTGDHTWSWMIMDGDDLLMIDW